MNRKPVAALTFLVFALSGMLSLCTSAFAHHGASAYAETLTTVKDATVTKFQWGNPHSIVFFDAKDAGGKIVHWAAEAGSPSALGLIGWSKNALQPGDKITVYVFRAKSGNPVGRLNKLVMADGTELRDSQLGAKGGDGK